ncbi:MAG: hypothetical protein JXR52_03430 [Bacteroidales bacterium]|nr:hypothetical protein [Bacteroidales bacterium]
MKKLANIKFWSFLAAGILCVLGGTYVLISGIMSEPVAIMLIIAAVVQLTIFYLLLFFWKKK